MIRTDFERFFVWYENLISCNFFPDAPIYAGKPINTRSAMIALVRMLQPKKVLEIGSYHFETADVIAKTMEDLGFNDYRVDSFDIKRGGYDGAKPEPAHHAVKAYHWYPHHTPYDDWKYSDPGIVYPQFRSLSDGQIFEENMKILGPIAPEEKYDMIYVDGDHSYEGVVFDWAYCEKVSHGNTLIIFDDLYGHKFPGIRKFFDEVPGRKYDFSDWNEKHPDQIMNIGVSLITPK